MPDLWLPFTQDTRQQGLSNASVTVVGSGASINANGKLGKCYYLDGTSNGYITTDFPTNFGTNDFTISLWVKIPTISSGSYYTIVSSKQSPAISVGVGIYWNYSQKRFLWSTADGTNATEIWMADAVDTIVYDKWIHLVMVRDNNDSKKGCFYINGTRYELASVPVIRNITTATNLWVGKISDGHYPCKLYISDIRVWNDHALSPKEVEILSRGLVCHYPLTGGGRGGDNIMPNSYTMQLGNSSVADGVWRLAGTSNMNRSRVQIDDGFYAFENSGIQTANDGSCYGIDSFVFEANTTYTMSMIARITEGTEGYAGFAIYNATIIGGTHTKVDKGYSVTPLTTSWKRTYITFTTTGSTTRNIYIGVTTGSTSVTTQMALVKIEKGDKSTPWIPKFTDLEYSKMGYDSNIEYDVSGYRNNGTKNGTIAYSSDTARYSVSTVFDGNSASIQIPNLYEMLGSNGSASYSISVWTYKSQIGTKSYQTILGGGSGFEIEARNAAGTDPQYVLWNWEKIAAPYEFNKWNHMVFTKQGNKVKLYVNGVLANQGTSSSAIVNSNYFIGAWNTATQQNYEGQMSDFRIYATALSDEQVAELYNTAVSVANNGTLMGYELVEV